MDKLSVIHELKAPHPATVTPSGFTSNQDRVNTAMTTVATPRATVVIEKNRVLIRSIISV